MFDGITFTEGQKTDVEELLQDEHALIWNDVGTGKTLTTLRLMYMAGYDYCVVIGPPTATGMWTNTLERYYDMEDQVVNITAGKELNNSVQTLIREGGIRAIVTTYSLCNNVKVRGQLQEFLRNHKCALIVDEADYCKSPESKRTQHILGTTKTTGRVKRVLTKDGYVQWERPVEQSLASLATEVYQLTGTPVGRYWDDLYAQLAPVRMSVLRRYNVDTYHKFRRRYCYMKDMRVSRNKVIPTVGGNKLAMLPELRNLLKECNYVRRLIDDELPSPVVTYRKFPNPHVPQVGDYSPENVERELKKKDSPFSKVYREIGVKFASIAAGEMLREWRQDAPLLVGFMHLDVGKIIHSELVAAGVRAELVQGSVSAAARDLIRDKFNAGEIDCIVGQMLSMKTSWNLQERCSRVVIVEPNASPGTIHQFVGRVRRKGQKDTVNVENWLVDHPLIAVIDFIRLTKLKNNHMLFDASPNEGTNEKQT